MPRYTCVSCSGKQFQTLQAARIHDEQPNHSVIDRHGTPIAEYPQT